MRVLSTLVAALMITSALLLGILSGSTQIRKIVFAHFLNSRATANNDLISESRGQPSWTYDVMCPHILTNPAIDINASDLSILDIGTGAGASLACYAELRKKMRDPAGLRLVLVEPNDAFTPGLIATARRLGLGSNTQIIAAAVEDLRVENTSLSGSVIGVVGTNFDVRNPTIKAAAFTAAVSVHVWCSVRADLLGRVTEKVAAALKDGGVYLLLDHTVSSSFPLWDLPPPIQTILDSIALSTSSIAELYLTPLLQEATTGVIKFYERLLVLLYSAWMELNIEKSPPPAPTPVLFENSVQSSFMSSAAIPLRVVQDMLNPLWSLFGHGCTFADIPTLYRQHLTPFRTLDIYPFHYLVWPHVAAVATK